MSPGATPALAAAAQQWLLAFPAVDPRLATGVVLTIVGLVLQLQVAHQRISAEEAVKDGRLTEGQALWRVRLYAFGAPALIVAGGVMLLAGMSQHLA